MLRKLGYTELNIIFEMGGEGEERGSLQNKEEITCLENCSSMVQSKIAFVFLADCQFIFSL